MQWHGSCRLLGRNQKGNTRRDCRMRKIVTRWLSWFGPLTIVILCTASGAWAQEGARGLGLRAGVGIDPTQFYFGGHITAGPVVEKLWFRPNVEVGFGDNH